MPDIGDAMELLIKLLVLIGGFALGALISLASVVWFGATGWWLLAPPAAGVLIGIALNLRLS